MRFIDGDLLIQEIFECEKFSNREKIEFRDMIAKQEKVEIEQAERILVNGDQVSYVTKDFQRCGHCGENVESVLPDNDAREHIKLWMYCPKCGTRLMKAVVDVCG